MSFTESSSKLKEKKPTKNSFTFKADESPMDIPVLIVLFFLRVDKVA